MSKTIAISMAAALIAIGMTAHTRLASAIPVDHALAIKNAAPSNIETVRWRGGRHRSGRHFRRSGGWRNFGGGFAAGAIFGGLLAEPYYYQGPYYYAEPDYYYYYGSPSAAAVRYCIRRFKSYDLRSGTYLGYDGYRHPCP
jgi:BA14K-like protein